MKLLSATCLFLLLASHAYGQGDNPDFGGPDVTSGPEPDKDAPLTTLPPDDKPSEAATTEEVKDTDTPVTSARVPNAAPDADGALPVPENCTGVMCDFEALRQCDAPVLFAKQCCPICPTLDVCDGVTCNDSEVCTVHNGRAICCTNLSAPAVHMSRASGHRHQTSRVRLGRSPRRGVSSRGRPRAGHGARHGAYSSAATHHKNLRCRYELPNNCTLRFAKPMRPTPTTGACVNVTTCNATESCVVKLQATSSMSRSSYFSRSFSRRRRYRQVAKCCMKYRPECPTVQKPSILGKCHLPGEPIPMKNKTCHCTQVTRGKRTPGYFFSSSFHGRRIGAGCASSGTRFEMSYSIQRRRLVRCMCKCAQHESHGHHSARQHFRNRRCRAMSDMTNVCRDA